MKFYNALSDFLYDKKYFITIFDIKLHLFRYTQLNKLTSTEIILKMPDFKLIINGDALLICQMNKEEMLIQGNIYSVRKEYE